MKFKKYSISDCLYDWLPLWEGPQCISIWVKKERIRMHQPLVCIPRVSGKSMSVNSSLDPLKDVVELASYFNPNNALFLSLTKWICKVS